VLFQPISPGTLVSLDAVIVFIMAGRLDEVMGVGLARSEMLNRVDGELKDALTLK
jgi:hypothetical protein